MTAPSFIAAAFWTLSLLAASVLGFAAGRRVVVGRLKRRHEEMSEECVSIALLAVEAGDPDRALEWFRHARGLAPGNARLAAQEAWCLGELGRVDEAIEAYAEASFLSDDGLADLDAALLLLREGGAEGKAEARLTQALHRSPELALEIRRLPEVRPLRGRAAYDHALSRALARLGPPPSRHRP